MAEFPTNFLLEVEQLINEGLFDKAINICEQGLLLYPSYASAMITLTKAYFLKNDMDTARQIITKAQKLFPLNFAVTNMKNNIEAGTITLYTIEPTSPKEKNTNELELPADIIEEVEEIIDEVNDEAMKIEDKTITEIEDKKEESSNKEVFTELEKIANLLEMIGKGDMPDTKTVSQITENGIANIENEIVENEIVENEIIENEIVENEIVENEIIENEIVENEIVENEIVENNILDTELQKIDCISKTDVERLYEIDLAFPRTTISTQFDWYSANHIPIDFATKNLHLFSEKLSFADCHEVLQNVKLDTKTQNILNIAESLKGAKIPRIDEDEPEEESFEVPIVASETMAKILVKQEKIPQAIEVYNMLILEKPDKTEHFQAQIDLLLNAN